MTRKQLKAKQKSAVRMIGYCRVSTDEQAERGVSLASQRRKIRAQCEARGYELVKIESDEGVCSMNAHKSTTSAPHSQ